MWSKRVLYSVMAAAISACGWAGAQQAAAPAAKDTPQPAASAPKPLEQTTERGPARATVRVDRNEITIAQRVTLEIELSLEEGYTAEFPKFGEKLDQFGITSFDEKPPVLDKNNRVIRKRSYVLEPFLSGEYVIPPMTIRFWKEDAQQEGEVERHEIETATLNVKVTSLLPEDTKNLQLVDIRGPVDLPMHIGWQVYAGIGGILALLATGAGFILWRRLRKREEAVVVIPPHEIAFRALEQLLAEDLIEKGELKEFHTRLSDILRRFLENRFALHAPEQTTEEFLRDRRTEAVLSRDSRSRLRDFLTHCDLVKFAEHVPTNEQIQGAFDVCKEFILATPAAETAQPEGGTA